MQDAHFVLGIMAATIEIKVSGQILIMMLDFQVGN